MWKLESNLGFLHVPRVNYWNTKELRTVRVQERRKPNRNNLDVQEEFFGKILYSTFISGILCSHYE